MQISFLSFAIFLQYYFTFGRAKKLLHKHETKTKKSETMNLAIVWYAYTFVYKDTHSPNTE